MRILIPALTLSALLFAGFGCAGPAPTPTPAPVPEAAEESEAAPFVGTWSRTSITVSGEPVESVPATLTLAEDSYASATSTCTTQGSVLHEDDAFTLTITQHNCPGPVPGPVTYTYVVSDEGDAMTTTTVYQGQTIVETYIVSGE